MMTKLYGVGGAFMLAALCYVQYTGWCLATYDKITGVPPSVRNNPGSYRSHYTNYYVHVGGK